MIDSYNTSDFSPIHGPDETPIRVGWYCTQWAGLAHSDHIQRMHADPSVICPWNMHWWNGHVWMDYPDDGRPGTFQDRAWFGLKEKAQG